MGVANIASPVILPSARSFFVRHLSEYVGLWPHLSPSPPAPASGLARAPCPHPLRILISLFGLLSINKAPRPVQHARIVPSRFSHHAIGHLHFLPQNFTCFCRKYHLFLPQNVPCFYRKYFPFPPTLQRTENQFPPASPSNPSPTPLHLLPSFPFATWHNEDLLPSGSQLVATFLDPSFLMAASIVLSLCCDSIFYPARVIPDQSNLRRVFQFPTILPSTLHHESAPRRRRAMQETLTPAGSEQKVWGGSALRAAPYFFHSAVAGLHHYSTSARAIASL